VFLGDLGEGAQTRLLRSIDLGPVDLVKVAHHGSADQSEALYRELAATVGVIGVGADNGYGHPTDRLLGLLNATGTVVVRTDHSGTAVLTADGDGRFRLWSERAEQAAVARGQAGGEVGSGP
jgi:competence protein ComEC